MKPRGIESRVQLVLLVLQRDALEHRFVEVVPGAAEFRLVDQVALDAPLVELGARERVEDGELCVVGTELIRQCRRGFRKPRIVLEGIPDHVERRAEDARPLHKFKRRLDLLVRHRPAQLLAAEGLVAALDPHADILAARLGHQRDYLRGHALDRAVHP